MYYVYFLSKLVLSCFDSSTVRVAVGVVVIGTSGASNVCSCNRYSNDVNDDHNAANHPGNNANRKSNDV